MTTAVANAMTSEKRRANCASGVSNELQKAFGSSAQGEDEHRRQRHEDERKKEEDDQARRHRGAPASTDDRVRLGAHSFGAIFITRCFQTASTISFLARRQPPKSATENASSILPNSG